MREIALSQKVVDDRHWKPAQQQHLVRRLEKPNFVIEYEANDVAAWMMNHGFRGTGVVPDDNFGVGFVGDKAVGTRVSG